jgi:diphosphomevalonate decarboxylase
MRQIEVFSPVNIAWLKYMGKVDVSKNKPTNPSLSVTLKNAGTRVMAQVTGADSLSVHFGEKSSWLDDTGRNRVEAFLIRIEPLMKECLIRFGFNPILKSVALDIETENTIPEKAGIASSASSFSAYTLMFALALSQDQSAVQAELDQRGLFLGALAQISSLGSGSSGRSMFAPFCLWDESGFHPVRSQLQQNYVHMIVIFEDPLYS